MLWLVMAALAATAVGAAAQEGPTIDSVQARWRCNVPACNGPDWTGAVINWPWWAAHPSNGRSGNQSRSVFSLDGEPLFPYMGSWAEGCEVTAVTGEVLIIEWQRGTDVWRETWLDPGQTHVIDLVRPEDGAMIETSTTSTGFSVMLRNCTPQPIHQADLGVSLTDGRATATPGATVAYTITVANAGPQTLPSLTLVDTLPAALRSPVFTPAAGSYDSASGAWTGIQLAPGRSISMSVAGAIAPGATGSLVNRVTVTADPYVVDPDPSDNAAADADTLLPSADLAVALTGPATATAGEEATYVITVINHGPSDASSVEVQDPTPAGLTFVSNQGDCTAAFPCALGHLAAGDSRSITATFSLPADRGGREPVHNVASVAGATADPDSSNNSAAVSTSLVGFAFYTLAPCRLLDTRGPADAPALGSGPARTFPIAGNCGVPRTARAVSVNLTVTEPTHPGDLRLYPAGLPPSPASAVNYAAGQTRANSAIVTLGADGGIEVLCAQAAGTAHFLLDVNGYFE